MKSKKINPTRTTVTSQFYRDITQKNPNGEPQIRIAIDRFISKEPTAKLCKTFETK